PTGVIVWGGAAAAAGGSTLASDAVHVAAVAGGAIGTTSPIAAADTTDADTIRRIAAMSHLSGAGRRADVRG
ncbi:MAG: hypothetical protein ACRDTS_17615, partial [Mycobacterium sp.]